MASAELPRGTVTMLFTDIEGSTRLLQELGRDSYVEALEEHRRLVRDACDRHGGVEVETQGDSFHFAFSSAPAGVLAAADVHRALARTLTHVRIGLHTGEPVVTEGLYAGLDVHRAARVMAAGHGGQVLVSEATRAASVDSLPDGYAFVDLGAHRLKDLTEPQRLFQLLGEGLEREFPAPHTLGPNVRLPVAPNRLIGRGEEVTALTALLADEAMRFVTLVGPGGSGKTRLAVHAAAELADRYPDGVVFVGLAPLRDPDLVLGAIANAVGHRPDAGRPLAESLADALAGKEILIVLDNVEHVVAGAAALPAVLSGAPGAVVLATSREPLHVTGERLFNVAPLPVADAVGGAVALFVERARAVAPQFGLSDANIDDVVAICARLDGLPLAIELAAARTRSLSPRALLTRLDRRLELLTGGPRDADERQRTLRATIDWSYELLTSSERRVFTRLAPFAGGARLDALEAAIDARALDGVASLVDKSLVRKSDDEDGEPRYWLLETIREYAAEQLTDADETHARHARFFLDLAEELAPSLRGPQQAEALGVLERELDNLRVAYTFLLEHAEGDEALRLGAILSRFAMQRGHIGEGVRWVELALGQRRESTVRPRALCRLALMSMESGDVERAAAAAKEALELDRAAGDVSNAAESAAILGDVAAHRGDLATAGSVYAEAAEYARASGNTFERAIVLYNLANVKRLDGDRDATEALMLEALELGRELGDAIIEGVLLVGLGALAAERGDDTRALSLLAEGTRVVRGVRYVLAMVDVLEVFARVAAESGEHERAARLFAAFDSCGEEIGKAGVHPAEAEEHDKAIAATRAALGDDRFAAASAAGAELSLDEALDYALEAVPVSSPSG